MQTSIPASRERSRPCVDSGVGRASDDPLTLERFGKLALHATTRSLTRAS
ncbi:hypothetical protein LMG31841_05432 [Paraburkholderia saeva]|uniref:Uncharacterized protein n=1 Tax=Paraburkholderia saeva TaxID=2777537 RepID=A0A9N8X5M7_9BURK|nr:hypothetical protein R70241_03978 [Paraburkholderia saeva]CAG4924904.1 hypothetical protein LMG31841_05432 [Paraburkholderia saeva]